MVMCAVKNCNNRAQRGGSLRFFRFPKDANMLRQWLKVCKSDTNIEHARVCSTHFDSSSFWKPLIHVLLDYTPKSFRNLKDDAVPSINMLNSEGLVTLNEDETTRTTTISFFEEDELSSNIDDLPTEKNHPCQGESAKMESDCSAVEDNSEQCERTTMEETAATLHSTDEQYSLADTSEFTIKVEPDQEMTTLTTDAAPSGAVPAEVQLVEVPDSALSSYINSFNKIDAAESKQADLPSPCPSKLVDPCREHSERIQDTLSSRPRKPLQRQSIGSHLENEGRDKFVIFSEFVASKLRELRSTNRKVTIMNSIIELFEEKDYDELMTTNKK